MATNDELLALRGRVLDDPDDLEALRVFGDALMEAGDELGFHIAESLSGDEPPLSPELQTRLLGRLGSAVAACDVRHGFLRHVSLSSVNAKQLRGLIGRAEWEGVTSVSLGLRRRPRGAANAGGLVLPLLRHPVCRHVRAVEQLGFEAFMALCETELRYERLHLVDLPYWGINTPLRRGTLSVRNLALDGRGGDLGSVLPWLKTWGRAVYDRVEVLVLGAEYGTSLEAVLDAPGASLRQIAAVDGTATREASGWHFGLTLRLPRNQVHSANFVLPRVQALAERIEHLQPLASRFTVRAPEAPLELLEGLTVAAAGRPIEFEWLDQLELEPPSDDIPF